ncbi:MAG: DUF3576 domain-containing protein [Candidatus Pacebacteria bacterium]|nr:DUF3576 domain-containing protein [Candidatus Paceibacterota bacterium]
MSGYCSRKTKTLVQFRLINPVLILLGLLVLSACGLPTSPPTPNQREAREAAAPKIFGDLVIGGKSSDSGFDKNARTLNQNLSEKFGNDKKDSSGIMGTGYAGTILWRATLDTISFLPLASADENSGIIITDWYSLPEFPAERVKVNAYVKSFELRSDALKISYFKQVKDKNGQWADSAVDSRIASDLENTVLSRARQMKLDSQAAKGQNP